MKIEWAEEKRQLLGEKAALQDAAQRLNAQIRNSETAAKKAAEAEAAGRKAKSSIEVVGTPSAHSLLFLMHRSGVKQSQGGDRRL